MKDFAIPVVLCFCVSWASAQEEKKAPDNKPAPLEKEYPRLRREGRDLPGAVQPAVEDGKAKNHETMEKQGWTYLFDSRPARGKHKAEPFALWRVRNPDAPARNFWKVIEEGGELILRNEIAKDAHGTDLISRQKFWDFELHVEFRVPPSSNSGVYLRGRYEIQITSLAPGKETKPGLGDLGAIYNVREPLVNASKGPGGWQILDATIRGFRITGVRLNGELIHASVEIPENKHGGTGSQLAAADDASEDPNAPGPIFLQGDHGNVDFRNVRVRPRPSFLRPLTPERDHIRELKGVEDGEKTKAAK